MFDSQMILNNLKDKYQQTVNFAGTELLQIKTCKANPSLVEGIIVETYNKTAKLKLKELSTISTRDAATLIVIPFDISTLIDIEKAIQQSPLGLSSRLEGKTIYITIPPLSEEQRLNYSKLVNQIIENSKNKLRLNRDEGRKNIKNQYEAKSLTQDDKYRIEKEIDDLTKKFSDQLDELRERKTKDLMSN